MEHGHTEANVLQNAELLQSSIGCPQFIEAKSYIVLDVQQDAVDFFASLGTISSTTHVTRMAYYPCYI